MVKYWQVMGGRGWWWQNYGWSWMVAQFSNALVKDIEDFLKNKKVTIWL